MDGGLARFEVSGHPCEGAARTCSHHEGVHGATSLLPNLHPRRRFVHAAVGQIVELVGKHRPFAEFCGAAASDIDWMLRICDGGRLHHFERGTKRADQSQLLGAHVVSRDEQALVAASLCRQRKAHPSAACCGLNNRAAGFQMSRSLGFAYDSERDAILAASAGI